MNSYYINQAGSGIAPYSGVRFQKGHGFFGRIFKGGVSLFKDLLPYLGEKAFGTIFNMGSDFINRRKGFGDAITSNLKKTAFDIADDALVKIKQFKGEGIRRLKYKSKTTGSKRKSKTVSRNTSKKTNKKSIGFLD